MGEFSPLLAKLDNFAQLFDGRGMERALTEVGLKGKKVLLETAADWAGADRRLSGWPRAGQLSAGFDVTASGVVFKPRPYGLWVVGDRGRRSTTAPRRGKGTRRISFPDGEVRSASKSAPIRIGGTRGHQILTIARKRIEDDAPKWLFEAVQAEARRVWS
jgi:hypothetical protein